MHVSVKVYLNEGEDAFWGFHNTFADAPRLRLAAAFNLVWGQVEGMPHNLLEHIYDQLNVGGNLIPAQPWTDRYRAERNRSLTVGDVVVLGETAWSCEGSGWVTINTEDLVKAIGDFNEAGAFHQ